MYFKYKPTYNIGCAFSFTLIMEILSNFEGSLEITQILCSERLLKKRTLETVNLNKQNKHCSQILMKYLSVTLSLAAKERNPVRLPVTNRDKTSE